MKYARLFLLFFLINTMASGQSGIPLKLFIYPNISQPVYRSNDADSQHFVDLFKKVEKPKMSYSFGVQAGLPLNDKWSLFSGANYMMTGYKTKKLKFMPAVPDPLIPEFFQTKYNIVQIEIPVHAQRVILKNEKINLYALAGPSIWFNISHKKIETSTYLDGRIKTEKTDDASTDFKAVNIAASAGLGIEWTPNPKFGFFIQPTAQMGLLGMALDAPLNRDILNFGIAVGINLK